MSTLYARLSPAQKRIIDLMDSGRKQMTRVWVREHDRYEYHIGDEVLVGIGRTVIAMEARGRLIRKGNIYQLPNPF